MFECYDKVLPILFVGSIYGLVVIWYIVRKDAVTFMFLSIVVSVFMSPLYPLMNFVAASFTRTLYHGITISQGKFSKENNNLCFLMYSFLLAVHTSWPFWRARDWNLSYNMGRIQEICTIMFILPLFLLQDVLDRGVSHLLPYCPAMLDIFDGIEMRETQLDPETKSISMQITICMAILTFYISSLLEIYHLKFPKQTTGSIMSERKVKLIQLVCSVVFLVLRLVLLARNPNEFFFVSKTIIRVFSHYQMWSNLRRGQKTISVEATELSTQKVSCLYKSRKIITEPSVIPLWEKQTTKL